MSNNKEIEIKLNILRYSFFIVSFLLGVLFGLQRSIKSDVELLILQTKVIDLQNQKTHQYLELNKE